MDNRLGGRLWQLSTPTALLMMAGFSWAAPPDPGLDAGIFQRDAFSARPERAASPSALPLPAAGPVPAFADLGSSVRIFAESFRLRGARAFSEAELQAVLAPYRQRTLTLAELKQAVDSITQLYRSRGFIASYATVSPKGLPMHWQPGTVEIIINETRLERITIKNNSRANNDVVRNALGLQAGQHIHIAQIERGLDIVEGVPGVRVVGSQLVSGVEAGTVEYVLTLDAEPALKWSMQLDNHGWRTTGNTRGTLDAKWASPTGWGDTLEINATTSGNGMNQGQLSYVIPITPGGLQLKFSAGRLIYRLEKEYKSLDYYGVAEAAAVDLVVPLIKDKSGSISMSVGGETKELQDQTPTSTERQIQRIDSTRLTFQGDSMDTLAGGAQTTWKLALTASQLRSSTTPTPGIDNNFARFNSDVRREQSLALINPGLSLNIGLRSQYARKNMVTAEKFAIGGPDSVRAFPKSEAYGDLGWTSSIELMQRLSSINGLQSAVSVFYDAGGVAVSADPAPGADNARLLRGYGVGFQLNYGSHYAFKAALAKPIGEGSRHSEESDKSTRAWLAFEIRQ